MLLCFYVVPIVAMPADDRQESVYVGARKESREERAEYVWFDSKVYTKILKTYNANKTTNLP